MAVTNLQTAEARPVSTNRIVARLDGLSGESDPRLVALRNRIEQLGFTLLAMGTSPATQSQGKTSQSAHIVVSVDTTKIDMSKAMDQFRALETFTFIEQDQLLQQRK